jgi:chorismate-pyruvate lyase
MFRTADGRPLLVEPHGLIETPDQALHVYAETCARNQALGPAARERDLAATITLREALASHHNISDDEVAARAADRIADIAARYRAELDRGGLG